MFFEKLLEKKKQTPAKDSQVVVEETDTEEEVRLFYAFLTDSGS